MAYDINDLTGTVVTPGGVWPYGALKDAPSGTVANTKMLGDTWQLFQKLMDEGGITPNGLPDNTANGFQLYEALVSPDIWAPTYDVLTLDGDWDSAGLDPSLERLSMAFDEKRNMIYFSGAVRRSVSSNGSNQKICTLAGGVSPAKTKLFVCSSYIPIGFETIYVTIASNGEVTPFTSGTGLTGLDVTGAFLSLDGVSFHLG